MKNYVIIYMNQQTSKHKIINSATMFAEPLINPFVFHSYSTVFDKNWDQESFHEFYSP